MYHSYRIWCLYAHMTLFTFCSNFFTSTYNWRRKITSTSLNASDSNESSAVDKTSFFKFVHFWYNVIPTWSTCVPELQKVMALSAPDFIRTFHKKQAIFYCAVCVVKSLYCAALCSSDVYSLLEFSTAKYNAKSTV